MNRKIIPLFAFGLAGFVQLSAWGQVPVQRKAASEEAAPGDEAAPAADEEPVTPPKQVRSGRSARRSGGKKAASVADKQAIESYLQGRLGDLSKTHRGQENFGRRMAASWDSFWVKMYKERKLFEVRVARQRLDLFESLGSLDPAAHAAAIADYERLQSNVLKSFEDAQKAKMADFFNQITAELKDYSVEQEKARQDFMAQAQDAWQSQKTGTQ